MSRFLRLVSALNLFAAIAACLLTSLTPTALHAQLTPIVERPIPFDSAGRLMVITPALVSRLELAAPSWPVDYAFREARMYMTSDGTRVLSVLRTDGVVVRYALNESQGNTLIASVATAIRGRGEGAGLGPSDGTGMELSQPAGNAFVRNQTLLGLTAYGPATSAILSKNGSPVAVGGYFLAAGSAFFVAAKTVKDRRVTRAQNLLASHGGIRGGIAGAGVAAIGNADNGPGYGAPILVGSVLGTIGGYRFARSLSDGEAASSALMADLTAATALGIAGAFDMFEKKRDSLDFDKGFQTKGKAAIGAAIGAGILGYAQGPQYARRASYNVTAGDASVAFAGSAIGALAATALITGSDIDTRTASAVATAGLLTGFALSDRLLVRTGDRTPANGTLVQLGAAAGALMGGGLAAMTESRRQGALALVTVGSTLGLIAADRILEPGPDGGPLRGVLSTSSLGNSSRLSVSLAPLATALAFQAAVPRAAPAGLHAGDAPVVTSYPVVRIAW